MGFLFTILVLTPLWTLLLYILSRTFNYLKLKNRWIIRILTKIDDFLESMIWNGLIYFLKEECLVLCVISLIQISDLRL
jgi:hypothetical protein